MESIAQLPSQRLTADIALENAQPFPIEAPRSEAPARPLRGRFNRRLVFIALAAAAVGVALFVGWGWLGAAGLTSLIVGLLPCAAMCVVGVCASRSGGKGSCQGSSAAPASPVVQPERNP